MAKKQMQADEEPMADESFSMGDLMSRLMEQKDAREKAFSEMASKLFDKSSLLMISRLNKDLAYYIIRHMVLIHMFQQYWNKIEVEYELKSTSEGWICDTVYKTSELEKHMLTAYKNVVEDILQITISFEGLGRKEILEAMMSAEAKMIQEEFRKQRGGMIGKFIN